MSEEQLDRLGRLADKADNFAAASQMPIPAAIQVTAMTQAMGDIANELKAIYREVSGENPWEV